MVISLSDEMNVLFIVVKKQGKVNKKATD